MKLHIGRVRRARQRRGIVIPYLAVAGVVLVGLMGLAVDMGRVQAAKTELHSAADAAARSGASALLYYGGWTKAGGFSNNTNIVAAENAAISVMKNSRVDGTFMTSAMFSASNTSDNSRDLQVGNWNFATRTFTTGRSPINAVQVMARRTTATSDPISLLFTAVLGRRTDDVFCISVAAVADLTDGSTADGSSPADEVAPQTISAKSNPYLAGAPAFDPSDPQKGSYASAPELAATDYNQKVGPNYWQDDASKADALAHPTEFDMAGPPGGTVTGSAPNPLTGTGQGDQSESPVQINNTDGVPVPLEAGDVIQISVPDTYNGQPNLITNVNGAVTTTANGFIDGQNPTPSPVYEDVGAIPTNDSADMNQYAAYQNDQQANNTTTGNESNATTTNLSTSAGDDDVIKGSENNITNSAAPLNSMMGVFLPGTNGQPTAQGTNAPPGYDFSSQTARDYTSLSPSVQQAFYVGDGTTSDGATQSVVVPAGANNGRFFLGTMDGQEWANNSGQFGGVTFNLYRVQLVQ